MIMSGEGVADRLTKARKHRGVACVSSTRLKKRAPEFEAKEKLPAINLSLAQGMQHKRKALGTDFRANHTVIVDLTANEDQQNKRKIILHQMGFVKKRGTPK